MRLDDLQTLVHHRRRVHRDLGAHVPVRVRRGLLADPVRVLAARAEELLRRSVAEGAARRRQDDLAHGAGRHALEALEDGRVLGVGWRHAHSVLLQQRQDSRPASDQSLLVGQGNVLARLDRGHRRAEARRADDARDDDVRGLGRGARARRLRASHNLKSLEVDAVRRQRLLELRELGGVADANDLQRLLELRHLLRQQLGVAARAHRDDLELVRPRARKVERLRADGPRRPEDGNPTRPRLVAGHGSV
mmetsp:Transcript_30180/g.101748  ORF Transcript_30180/g.101748 Transcript_30180/m.101748 type:complete len:249 (-) Transcript_30180:242-988(-)